MILFTREDVLITSMLFNSDENVERCGLTSAQTLFVSSATKSWRGSTTSTGHRRTIRRSDVLDVVNRNAIVTEGCRQAVGMFNMDQRFYKYLRGSGQCSTYRDHGGLHRYNSGSGKCSTETRYNRLCRYLLGSVQCSTETNDCIDIWLAMGNNTRAPRCHTRSIIPKKQRNATDWLSMLVTLLLVITLADTNFPSNSVSTLNYGIYFQFKEKLRPIASHRIHTFHSDMRTEVDLSRKLAK